MELRKAETSEELYEMVNGKTLSAEELATILGKPLKRKIEYMKLGEVHYSEGIRATQSFRNTYNSKFRKEGHKITVRKTEQLVNINSLLDNVYIIQRVK